MPIRNDDRMIDVQLSASGREKIVAVISTDASVVEYHRWLTFTPDGQCAWLSVPGCCRGEHVLG